MCESTFCYFIAKGFYRGWGQASRPGSIVKYLKLMESCCLAFLSHCYDLFSGMFRSF